jgi:hypothetical protein
MARTRAEAIFRKGRPLRGGEVKVYEARYVERAARRWDDERRRSRVDPDFLEVLVVGAAEDVRRMFSDRRRGMRLCGAGGFQSKA